MDNEDGREVTDGCDEEGLRWAKWRQNEGLRAFEWGLRGDVGRDGLRG